MSVRLVHPRVDSWGLKQERSVLGSSEPLLVLNNKNFPLLCTLNRLELSLGIFKVRYLPCIFGRILFQVRLWLRV